MSDATELYLANRQRLIDGHAYDPDQERDACGVGLVCAIDGKPRREVVELAIKALKGEAASMDALLNEARAVGRLHAGFAKAMLVAR